MISKYVLLISVLYLFDSSALPLSGHAIAISFPMLTVVYSASVTEISLILSLCGMNVTKYSLFQLR